MITIAAGALFAGAIGVPAAASRSAGCTARGKIIARDSAAVVYSRGGSAYACANSAGKTYKLGATGLCIGVLRAAPFALVHDLVGYGLTKCGVDTSSTQVVVRSLSSGRKLHNDQDVSSVPGRGVRRGELAVRQTEWFGRVDRQRPVDRRRRADRPGLAP